jgi:fatty acid synthase
LGRKVDEELHDVTVYLPDSVSAGRDRDPAETGCRTEALVDRLHAGEPYAIAFGGQGSAWLETLDELVSAAGIEDELVTLLANAELMLEPVARELVVVRPIGFDPLRWARALAAEKQVPGGKQLMSAACSLPGVLLTQVAAMRALIRQGMDFAATPPVAVTGHSQGVLAVEALRAVGARDVELLALAQLIGAAATLVARRRGISLRGDRSPMVSIANADTNRIASLLDEFGKGSLAPTLSVRNGRRSAVVVGTPEQLTRFELYCRRLADAEATERKDKSRGGAVFNPTFEPVRVDVGFHSRQLTDGVELVDEWAAKIGLDAELAHDMAESILVQPVDWVSQVTGLHETDARWILDLGPSDMLTRLTAPVIRGLGMGIVPAATRGGQRNLFTAVTAPEVVGLAFHCRASRSFGRTYRRAAHRHL